ncbi:MAG TPA: hypothetical protein PKZ91_07785 [Saprospiraceae bacterium]|nr:hypothetical protein [Saprospiraceae bacterium]
MNLRSFRIINIILALLFMIEHNGFSQIIPSGTWAVGADASLYFTLKSADPSGSIYIAPLVEYYPVNNLGIGFKGIIDYSKLTNNGFTEISTNQILQPYLKYFLYKGLSIFAGTQYVLEFNYQVNIHWGLGYSHFFSKRVAFTPLIEFNHNFYQYAPRPFHTNFSIGASYFFK